MQLIFHMTLPVSEVTGRRPSWSPLMMLLSLFPVADIALSGEGVICITPDDPGHMASTLSTAYTGTCHDTTHSVYLVH